MSDGCEQRERFPAALGEGYFRADETSFETLVAMSAGLASRLRFIDLQQRDVGHWGELFESDEALIMARIVSTDLRGRQLAFVRDAAGAPLELLAEHVVALAQCIDGWVKSLKPNPEPASRQLFARIEQLLAHPLGDDLQWVLERFGVHRWQDQPLALLRNRLDGAWFALRAVRPAPGERSDRELLRGRFFSFVSAIERVQDLARELLPQSLASQNHAPAAGLLMAFLQLHQQVQKRINRFTDRHADFYYDDVLRMRPLPAVPDSVHLVCQRDPRAAREVVVPQGTPFGAGKDSSGQLIEFVADNTLVLTDCQVTALCTLQLGHDGLISPEREFGYVTRAQAARLPWPAPPGQGDAVLPHWPLFGGSTPGQASSQTLSGGAPDHAPLKEAPGRPKFLDPHGGRVGRSPTLGASEEARIGLAIASPLLFLQEGEREITLKLDLAHAADTDQGLQHLVARILARPDAAQRLIPVLFKRYLLLAPELMSDLERADLNATARRLARQATARQMEALPVGSATAAPRVAPGPYERFLTEFAVRAPTTGLFFARLGKFFSRWLLTRQDWLSDAALEAVRETAGRLLDNGDRTPPVAGDPRCLLQGPNRPERELIFGQLFNSILNFSLTTPAGWMQVNDFFVTNQPAGDNTSSASFTGVGIVLRLRPQDPAVVACDALVHGEGWPTTLPVLRIQLGSHGRMYPYSLLEEMLLAEIALSVRVRGLGNVLMQNNLGPLDPSKPFMPFGPLPTTASYCIFGADEISRKNVTHLAVNVEWSGLPVGEGGFGSYYASYDPHLRNSSFTAHAGILRDGQWHMAGTPGSVRLFDTADAAGRLRTNARWVFSEAALRSQGRANDAPQDFKLGARNGFYRIQLNHPAIAFGHQAYPNLLTEVVSANATRRRRRPRPLPNTPYTPLIERLSLDYEAESHLVPGRDNGMPDSPTAERVLHLHPFGISQVYPGAAGPSPSLWPRFEHDGNLYIGLSAEELGGALSLHFHLRDETAVEAHHGESRPTTTWSYLASNQWHALTPSQVMSDTTCGFLTSGIVMLDVPRQIDRQNTILPDGCYWLRLSADGRFESFAGLYGVRTQALRASRVLRDNPSAPVAPLPAGSVREPTVTVFGLAAVAQIGASFGMRPAEDRRQMRTRTGERLQHRQRASTPWDYERLVLERFPSVLKVKCFSHLTSRNKGVSPGEVLVVVVPTPPTTHASSHAHDGEPVLSATAEPHLNAVELARIRSYLCGLASPFAQIQVRNAVYERIQVRCTVKLSAGSQAGQALRRINQAITDYISPWREGGCQPNFEWTVRCEDVEAHVRSLECVDFVTQLSLLHVAQSDQHVYTLCDTARGQANLATRAVPQSPWSIALPMREHMLNAVEISTDERPQATGISGLGVGGTLILGKVAS
ncbi:baseplate J/gp47 family protein [Rhizobacter sp. Root1221]|uniref:baseplate J/gp47 family protein n=1 Tax=Rhizobacter sp. Root1221 TaxID=1736433 RepID=UPI0006F49312|nr:baseplate J/gp47 family protein [Rhizobacter sp. Root1221]KQV85606.1 hypothetical protein ASC87_07960 [Rhizobacter sp. Root1221]